MIQNKICKSPIYIMTAVLKIIQSYVNQVTDHTIQDVKKYTSYVQNMLQKHEK